MESGEIYIYNTSVDNARFDTLRIEKGEFYYGGNVEQPTPYILLYPNALEQVIFIGPGEVLEYEATATDLNNYRTKGSDENKLMNQFRTDTQSATYSDTQNKARRFISEHPESVVSLYIFERYFMQNAQTTYRELKEVLELLRPTFNSDTYFMRLEGQVKELKPLNVGDILPDFRLKGRHSNSSMWKANSKHTLLLCWATWLPTYYDFMMKLRQASEKFDADRLRIVSLSIDAEYDRWENMTRYDSLTHIEHYIDTRTFDAPALRKAGITSVPSYYILDSKHKVVAKGNEAQQLQSDIQKYVEDKE